MLQQNRKKPPIIRFLVSSKLSNETIQVIHLCSKKIFTLSSTINRIYILFTRKQNQNHNGSRSSSPLSRYCSNSKDHPRCNGIANWKRSKNGKIGWKGRKKKAAFPSHPFKRTSSPLLSSKKQRNRWELESKFRVNSIFRAGMADEGVYVHAYVWVYRMSNCERTLFVTGIGRH